MEVVVVCNVENITQDSFSLCILSQLLPILLCLDVTVSTTDFGKLKKNRSVQFQKQTDAGSALLNESSYCLFC